MKLVEWNDSLSVQVTRMDGQHQMLMALVNDLNYAMLRHKGKDAIGSILGSLANYMVTHFSTEEKFFDRYGYPDAMCHKQEHDNFVKEVSQIRKDFDEDRICLSFKVLNFLSAWLKDHILDSDKKYSAFFNAKGLR